MHKKIYILVLFIVLFSCKQNKNEKPKITYKKENYSNLLDYKFSPQEKFDKKGLIFSDQGAWFGYSIPESIGESIGFSGPFLMTQQNGVWLTTSFNALTITKKDNFPIVLQRLKSNGYASHLAQEYANKDIEITQKLVYKNGHTALIETVLKNISNKPIELNLLWSHSPVFADGLSFELKDKEIQINSTKSKAKGYLKFPENVTVQLKGSLDYQANTTVNLKPKEKREYIISQTFIFPEYDWNEELQSIEKAVFNEVLNKRKNEKYQELSALTKYRKKQFQEEKYTEVLAKAKLTLQNNWRIPAGEIKEEGLFPSYHYKWFNGFWSWDSWKHAVGLSYYNTTLAKKQMRLMFDFQMEDGFIVDCVFRDTLIEKHNYRDTKPPLSVWAVAKIFERDNDISFVKEMYPKLKKYHEWWYLKRDHDKDGLCEYGSTDGSLVAAKWESGMDNAIRFDSAQMLKNQEGAYSMNQESVDLNAYLYAEKMYLATLAKSIGKVFDATKLEEEATLLKIKIQEQFFDEEDGWFYDTNLEGNNFIKGEGSEGWTALWAKVATQNQAEKVKNKMMNPKKFYTKVPFQTMSADHEKFNPLKGYWRGPNWLDQAYFGVKGLRNYGYNEEANKATLQILEGAEGVLQKGKSIRENYHPITGKGLNAKNFSWSAAHIIMLLMKD
ncbi:Glycoside hydrolase, family GH63 lipoprotein precursor [Tenacibaculum sp. 190524A02b]|uniref:MGH1-like glycoside hydrolase domain-containing protein n=1 Tax=Tenacibaculum vairaonense TaxID=3137860 RepID=UPI0032B2C80F